MKALFCKTAIALALLLAAGISSQAQTLREEYSKEFQVTSSSELKVDNQFGNITITDWDQNKVNIVVIVEVTHSDESKAKKLMDRIKIDITEEGGKVIAKTKFGDDDNLNLKNKGDKQTIKIDYFIKCPKDLKMFLDNQFGDIIVSSLTGPFSADLQFGSINAVSLTGSETNLDLQFGKLTIGTLKDAKIDIQHCEMVKIEECGNITIDAQLSELNLGSVQSLKADVSHCDILVRTVRDLLKLDLNMGNVEIENVAAGFKSITIDQNMGDLTIGIDPKAGYQLTAEVNMGSIKYPESLKVAKKKETERPGVTGDHVSGIYGDGASTIIIETNMGSVRIK